jgi:BirA family biotin operon repressor/biotin-[acetyl-CoA-carboxylase] ligase
VWTAPITYFETIASTSDWLKDQARDGAPEWSVCMAGRQTAGRGRQGRTWASPPGNLYLSVLLRPAFPSRLLALIPLAAGVAVAQALEETGVGAALKWPNDVVVGGRKLAGVLSEASGGAGDETVVVVGIGVNVAGPVALPPELLGVATSLAAESGRPAETLGLAAAVLARLTLCYDALGRGDADVVLAEWRSRSTPWWGRFVEMRSGDDVVRGVARDVDESGALLIELADGSLRRVLSGEVREVRRSE